MSVTDPRRAIPRTDALLADPRLTALRDEVGEVVVKAAVTSAQVAARNGVIAPADILEHALADLTAPVLSLRPVLNATGVVLHTNLGRPRCRLRPGTRC